MKGIRNAKQAYITDEERRKCRKVMKAFEELYRKEDIVVLDAGRYGFVKLQYYNQSYGFDVITTYTESGMLFAGLWQEWRDLRLLALAEGTPLVDMRYKEIFQCLPQKEQREIMKKWHYFKKKAGRKKPCLPWFLP